MDMNKESKVNPAFAQYLAIKAEYKHALLLYRMGDFYEAFFDDALAIAGALSLSFGHRGRHEGKPKPVLAIPEADLDCRINELVKAGFRVAVSEPIESLKEAVTKRGPKAVAERQITRFVSPKT